MLYLITIPIPNYYGDGVFEQPYYFNSDKFPSWEAIKTEVNKLHERDLHYPEYLGCHKHALESIKLAEERKLELPRLYGNLCQTSVPFDHKFGPTCFCARSIRPIVIEEPVPETRCILCEQNIPHSSCDDN